MIVIPLVIAVVTPRLVSLTVFFASFRGRLCAALIAVSFLVYTVIFWIIYYFKTRKERKRGEVLKLMFLSFITSLIGPCINVDPRSTLIFVSSYVSMIALVIVMSSLQIVACFFPHLLEDQFREIGNFSTFYWCLIAIVIITSLAPYLLLEERRQIISFQLGLGPICCDENYKFHWACEREYKALIHYHLKSSNNDEILNQNINGQNVLHYSLYNKKFESVKALILPPNDIFDDAQVRKIFCYSCYKGHDEVVKWFLRAYSQKQKFFLEKDDEETGNFLHNLEVPASHTTTWDRI